MRCVRTRHCPSTPWFDAGCRALRRLAGRLERIFRRTRSPTDRATWVHFVREMHASYRAREREYWETIITRQSKEPKKLWTTFNGLLGRQKGGQSQSLLRRSLPKRFWINSRPRSRPSGAPPPTLLLQRSLQPNAGSSLLTRFRARSCAG